MNRKYLLRFNRSSVIAALLVTSLATTRVARADEPRHEKIDHAQHALTDAYKDLEDASDDFDGHKKEAMEKISSANHALEKWHGNLKEAKEKLDSALEQLRVCKEKSHARHPKIEDAIDALEAAKDELRD